MARFTAFGVDGVLECDDIVIGELGGIVEDRWEVLLVWFVEGPVSR